MKKLVELTALKAHLEDMVKRLPDIWSPMPREERLALIDSQKRLFKLLYDTQAEMDGIVTKIAEKHTGGC